MQHGNMYLPIYRSINIYHIYTYIVYVCECGRVFTTRRLNTYVYQFSKVIKHTSMQCNLPYFYVHMYMYIYIYKYPRMAASQNCVWNVPRCSGRMERRSFASGLFPDLCSAMKYMLYISSVFLCILDLQININMYMYMLLSV